jgi:hypothetical protein
MPAPAPPVSPLTREVLRLGHAAVVSAADLWSRWIEIGLRHARLVVDPAGDGAPAAAPTPGTAGRHLLTELATAPWLSLERLGAELARQAAPPPRAYTVAGRPLILPVRVQDAAQGLAVYAVPEPHANAMLAARGAPVRAVGLGGGRAALMVFGVRYRTSDLGTFEEMGLAVLAAPAHDPWAMGLCVLAHPVTGSFSCEAGNLVWGYPKTVEPIDCEWGEREVSWTLRQGAGGPPIVGVRFPRGGGGASAAVAMPTYTLLDGRLHRTVFTRTGRGERVRAGGDGVTLTLGDAATRPADAPWVLLHEPHRSRARPILHAWTERLSGEFGPPVPVA